MSRSRTRKLRLFQDLGHKAVLIIGDYTALVGDPSGRDQTRARLTPEQVDTNAREYLTQVSKVIDIAKAEVRRNGEWFGRFTFLEVLSLTSKMTVQRMLERDDFSKRFHSRPESVPIYLHECLYPLMQGHDSVEIAADLELGGSEQLFNLMVGRRLQEAAGQVPQVCVTLPILRGLDGKRRMGKSLGNYVGVGESADQQFGKTMSIPDDLLREWFDLLTDRPMAEIADLTDTAKTHPMAAKKTLACDILTFYHGPAVATAAQTNWEKQFSDKQDPDTIPAVTIPTAEGAQDIGVLRLLVLIGFCKSNSEARQKVIEGAVTMGPDRTKVADWKATVNVGDGLIVRLGSKKIAMVRFAE